MKLHILKINQYSDNLMYNRKGVMRGAYNEREERRVDSANGCGTKYD